MQDYNAILKEYGLTKADVARAVGIDAGTLRGFFNGNNGLAPANLAKIDAYLSGIADGTIPRPGPKRRASALDSAADFPVPAHLAEVWPAYLDTRRSHRKGINTPSTLAYVVKRLEILAPDDPGKQRAIVEQSINMGYLGVFELREYKTWHERNAPPAPPEERIVFAPEPPPPRSKKIIVKCDADYDAYIRAHGSEPMYNDEYQAFVATLHDAYRAAHNADPTANKAAYSAFVKGQYNAA